MPGSPTQPESTSTCGKAIAVTPDNSTLFADGECRALYVGVSGNVTGLVAGTAVTFVGVPIGVLPVRFTRINATGTTATDMVAMY